MRMQRCVPRTRWAVTCLPHHMWILQNAPGLEVSQFWERNSLGQLLAGLWGKAPGLWSPLHQIKGTKSSSGPSLAVCMWKTKQCVTFLLPVGSPKTILIIVYGNSISVENSIGHFWVLNSQSIHSSSISCSQDYSGLETLKPVLCKGSHGTFVQIWANSTQDSPRHFWLVWMADGTRSTWQLWAHKKPPQGSDNQLKKWFWKDHGKQDGFTKVRISI